MRHKQLTVPMLVQGEEARALTPLPLRRNELSLSENWFEQLLYRHPELIPIDELEPGFGDLMAVAQQLPTPCGPLDLLFMDENGNIVLAETKLWRNPEARREVVGQIVNYATELSRWSYERLSATVREKRGDAAGDPLIDLAGDGDEEFDESAFVDAVSRNLSRGRFLLLIVGDGIHESVEQMAAFLQNAPQLSFRLALVEMSLYRFPDRPADLLIQPRIVARTREVTRAVVEIKVPIRAGDVEVKLPEADRPSAATGRRSLTEEDYFEKLGRHTSPATVEAVQRLLEESAEHDFEVEYTQKGGYPQLFFPDEDGPGRITFGTLKNSGQLGATDRVCRGCQNRGLSDAIWKEYLDALAHLIPDTERRALNRWNPDHPDVERLVDSRTGKEASFIPLLEKRQQWYEAIDHAIERIRQELASREERE